MDTKEVDMVLDLLLSRGSLCIFQSKRIHPDQLEVCPPERGKSLRREA